MKSKNYDGKTKTSSCTFRSLIYSLIFFREKEQKEICHTSHVKSWYNNNILRLHEAICWQFTDFHSLWFNLTKHCFCHVKHQTVPNTLLNCYLYPSINSNLAGYVLSLETLSVSGTIKQTVYRVFIKFSQACCIIFSAFPIMVIMLHIKPASCRYVFHKIKQLNSTRFRSFPICIIKVS